MMTCGKLLLCTLLTTPLLFSEVARAEDQKGGDAKVSNKSLYDFKVKNIGGKDVELSQYKGDVVLIVNVASY